MSEILNNMQNYLSDILPQLGSIIGQFFERAAGVIGYLFDKLTGGSVSAGDIYTSVIRWIMPLLALYILVTVLRSMLRVRNPKETWGYLLSPDLGKFPIHHWECTVGRARHCDIRIRFATVSKTQCALIRNDEGDWRVHNLAEKNITQLNGEDVTDDMTLRHGDTLSIGGVDLRFEAITELEFERNKARRIRKSRPIAPWTSFIYITIFQLLTVIQLFITKPDIRKETAISYAILCTVMWAYVLISRSFGKTGFEPEILAFFACTLNLAVTATALSYAMIKQTIAIIIGIALFLILGFYLRDLNRVIKTRHLMAGAAVILLIINIIFSEISHGARNWISVFGISFQPSELTKICFIFAGAAALDRLFEKRNLFGFMCLSGFCLLSLAFMSDFGTASVFFVTFLVIAFLRSGDFATLSLITGAAAGAVLLVLRFRPYVASRFTVWGHVWEQASAGGYQQVRTMSAASSGGLIGVGSGNGWLHNVAASETDLVFGVLCEEWGLIIALLAVFSICVLCIFAFRVVQTGRSSYYTIAACAATSLLVFQTMLNVFGCVDILPFTGVTFPFISCGGSSMIASWGLLAFLKAADTRQNASFAVRKKTALGELPPDPLYELTDESIPVKKSRGILRKKRSREEEEAEMQEFFSRFDDTDDSDDSGSFDDNPGSFNNPGNSGGYEEDDGYSDDAGSSGSSFNNSVDFADAGNSATIPGQRSDPSNDRNGTVLFDAEQEMDDFFRRFEELDLYDTPSQNPGNVGSSGSRSENGAPKAEPCFSDSADDNIDKTKTGFYLHPSKNTNSERRNDK